MEHAITEVWLYHMFIVIQVKIEQRIGKGSIRLSVKLARDCALSAKLTDGPPLSNTYARIW